MLSKLWAWLAAISAGVVAVLYWMMRRAQGQRDKAREIATRAERETEEVTELANTQSDLERARSKARQESKENANEKTDYSKRPDSSFGDSRLHDD